MSRAGSGTEGVLRNGEGHGVVRCPSSCLDRRRGAQQQREMDEEEGWSSSSGSCSIGRRSSSDSSSMGVATGNSCEEEDEEEEDNVGKVNEVEEFVSQPGVQKPMPRTPGSILAAYRNDLELAAELGKSLLERNKELEASLQQQQVVIEEQSQEIRFLSKQAAALREANESRLILLEQLECQALELERGNLRLSRQGQQDKERIRSLCRSLDALEGRCEELQKKLDQVKDAAAEHRRQQRRRRQLSFTQTSVEEEEEDEGHEEEEEGHTSSSSMSSNYSERDGRCSRAASRSTVEEEEAEEEARMQLERRLQELQGECERERLRREDLEAELSRLLQENAALQGQVAAGLQMVDDEDEVQQRSLQEEMMGQELACNGHCLEEHQEEKVEEQQQVVPIRQGWTCRGVATCIRRRLVRENNELSLQEELEMSGEFAADISSSGCCSSSDGCPHSSQSRTTQTQPLDFQDTFQETAPEYKKLFRDIFAVLQESMHQTAAKEDKSAKTVAPPTTEMRPLLQPPPPPPPPESVLPSSWDFRKTYAEVLKTPNIRSGVK